MNKRKIIDYIEGLKDECRKTLYKLQEPLGSWKIDKYHSIIRVLDKITCGIVEGKFDD